MIKILRKISIKNIFLKKTLRVYFDHASGAPLDPRIQKEVRKAETYFGNPSGIHTEGVGAKKLLMEARERIARVFSVRKNEIIFTSGGTEGNNLVIHGVIEAFKKNHPNIQPHIVVSSIEHASVLECVKNMKDVSVSYIPVSSDGFVSVKDIKELLRDETVLVSVQYVNNEIGSIQPIEDIAKMLRQYKKEKETLYPVFHTDACQAGNYLSLRIPSLGVDAMIINGSKLYAPRGTGCVYMRQDIPCDTQMYGGDQEYGYRAGTENVPGIVGLSYGVLYREEEREKENTRVTELRDFLIDTLLLDPRIHLYGGRNNRIANNINIHIDNTMSEEIVIRLDQRGFAVSEKSACKSEDETLSHVISAITDGKGKGSIRISLGFGTTKKDCIRFVKELTDILKGMKV